MNDREDFIVYIKEQVYKLCGSLGTHFTEKELLFYVLDSILEWAYSHGVSATEVATTISAITESFFGWGMIAEDRIRMNIDSINELKTSFREKLRQPFINEFIQWIIISMKIDCIPTDVVGIELHSMFRKLRDKYGELGGLVFDSSGYSEQIDSSIFGTFSHTYNGIEIYNEVRKQLKVFLTGRLSEEQQRRMELAARDLERMIGVGVDE